MNLIDALVLTSTGWRTEEEHALYLKATNVLYARSVELKKEHEIALLRARLNELEGQGEKK